MRRVIAVLSGQKGVRSVEPDVEAKTVRVRYDPSITTPRDLVSVINRADIRLQFRHRIAHRLHRVSSIAGEATAYVKSDQPL